MLRFVLTRLGLVIPTFLGIILLTFVLIRLVPGDPIEVRVGERGISPERHAELLHEMGLDRPLYVQFFDYVGGVLQGDLGISVITHRPVMDEFLDAVPGDARAGDLRHDLLDLDRLAGRRAGRRQARLGLRPHASWAPASPAIRCRSSGGACC